MNNDSANIIIYNTKDGKVNVALYAQDGDVWLIQNQRQNFLPPLNKTLATHS